MPNYRDQKIKFPAGIKIKQIRKSLKIRAKEVSVTVNITQVYLCYIEKGIRSPSKEKLNLILKALGITLEDITT